MREQSKHIKIGTTKRAIACGDSIFLDDLEDISDINTLVATARAEGAAEERERVLKAVYQEVDNNTLISEMYGWRGILEQSIENVREALTTKEHHAS